MDEAVVLQRLRKAAELLLVELAARLERRTLDLQYRQLKELAGRRRNADGGAEKAVHAAREVDGATKAMMLAVNSDGGLRRPRRFLQELALP